MAWAAGSPMTRPTETMASAAWPEAPKAEARASHGDCGVGKRLNRTDSLVGILASLRALMTASFRPPSSSTRPRVLAWAPVQTRPLAISRTRSTGSLRPVETRATNSS
ncbi:hypothetical protein D3C72_1965420 [compost metagenome]